MGNIDFADNVLCTEEWNQCNVEVLLEEKLTGTDVATEVTPFGLAFEEAAKGDLIKQFNSCSSSDQAPERFECTTCKRSYKHLFHLKAHLRECSSEPLFSCHLCERRFYQSRNLSRHLTNVHKEIPAGSHSQDPRSKNSRRKHCGSTKSSQTSIDE